MLAEEELLVEEEYDHDLHYSKVNYSIIPTILALFKKGGARLTKHLNKIFKMDTGITQEELDVLLAVRLACLCDLCYWNSNLYEANASKESELLRSLHITGFRIWDHVISGEVATQALTGVLMDLSEQYEGPMPFICFRGTKGVDDVKADLLSLLPADHITRKGTRVGKTGAGFLIKHRALLDLRLLDHCVAQAQQYGGLLLTGHSLGGALATLFTAELHHDHPELFESGRMKLVTFGSPKVFDRDTAQRLSDNTGFRHLRFVNDADVITMMPLAKLDFPLFHSGEVYFHPGEDSAGFQRIEGVFNFSPEPPNDALEMIEQTLTFALTVGDTHLMAVHSKHYISRHTRMVSKG